MVSPDSTGLYLQAAANQDRTNMQGTGRLRCLSPADLTPGTKVCGSENSASYSTYSTALESFLGIRFKDSQAIVLSTDSQHTSRRYLRNQTHAKPDVSKRRSRGPKGRGSRKGQLDPGY
jgi:hypothetical protein